MQSGQCRERAVIYVDAIAAFVICRGAAGMFSTAEKDPGPSVRGSWISAQSR